MQSLLYLHSTLIKYKVHGWFGGIFSSNEDLHSTLIKYKATPMCPHKTPNQNLHSTLIKYKENILRNINEIGKVFTFHSD